MEIYEIKVGMTESYSQTITDADIKSFAGISGDHNPVHMSDEYAEKSRFKRRIAHGMISSSFFFDTVCKVRNKTVIDGKAELYIPEEK